MNKLVFFLMAMIFTSSAYAWSCSEERTINKEFDIGALGNIRVQAGAGELSIKGGDQKGKIALVAKLCASDERLLAEMDVATKIDGEYADIETQIPKKWNGDYSAKIDLALVVPNDAELDVKDSSGDLDIVGIAKLFLVDSSGDVMIENVEGKVSLTDSSGAVKLRRVGSAEVTDSSGEIDAQDIAEDFTVNVDSSGDIEVRGVGGNLLVKVDSSGSINVEDILGNFTVQKDGSGGIDFSNVKGEVEIPQRKR